MQHTCMGHDCGKGCLSEAALTGMSSQEEVHLAGGEGNGRDDGTWESWKGCAACHILERSSSLVWRARPRDG